MEQPYSLPDIRKYPREIVISILVAMLAWQISRNDELKSDNDRLHGRVDTLQTVRIRMYDQMFWKDKTIEIQSNKIKMTDSLLREKTQPEVEQILKKKK